MNTLKIILLLLLSISLVLSIDFDVVKDKPIPNIGTTNKKQKNDVNKAAELLDYANLYVNKQKVIASYGSIHIDMQGTFTGDDGGIYHNIQAQLTTGPTVAHVNLHENLMSDSKSDQKGVKRKVVDALLKSLNSGYSYTVKAKVKKTGKKKN